MKRNAKVNWLAALRGGEFHQGMEKLHNTDNNTYCCLGVLAKLQYGNPYAGWVEDERGFQYTHEQLSPDQLRELGLLVAQQDSLIAMNDGLHNSGNEEGKNYTFTEIADWIEENL